MQFLKKNIFGILSCCLGLFLGFANPIFHFPPFIFLFLCSLNSIALKKNSPGEVFRTSLVCSIPAYSLALYWLVVPVHKYGQLPLILAIPCPILMGCYLSLFSSCYALTINFFKNKFSWPILALAGASVWASLEVVREYLFTGFPWLVLASSFSEWPFFIQPVKFIGSYGLGFALATCSIWISLKSKKTISSAFVLIISIALVGLVSKNNTQVGAEKTVLLVQGNINQDKKWEKTYQLKTINKYIFLTKKGLQEGRPDLVIWPETALPFYFQEVTDLSLKIKNFVRSEKINLITGAPGYKLLSSRDKYRLFNRAFLINEKGDVQGYYDKEHLVPFGEYVPLGKYLPFLHKLVEGAGDFSPGQHTQPMRLGNLALGMLICYEAIFPQLAQKRVEQGANILVNISNDAWFGDTSAPEQHLHLALLRAVEQGRYLVRSTNTGISVIVDPYGRIIKQTDLFTDAFLSGEIRLLTKTTFFHRYYFGIHCLLILSAIIFISLAFFKRWRG
ncbi:apolipoprotein N-acyltransferase [Desulfovulcanus ferrireducens]|uniref:apolipoprotein N-acyltransferase n=1 Tax=Desulfovulcanus ferrireducens TaxID=2831190 RepID=UPI00207BC701|nr:apolipoprotein N-acyltransferase [Desulfovulcanus ferrireducens]